MQFAVVLESVAGYPDAQEGGLIACRLDEQSHPGDQMYNLFAQVVAIKNELDFLPADGATPAPIFLDDRAPIAQELPWETLRREDMRFLALEERRPVGRIAGTMAGPGAGHTMPVYNPPLKVLAVISAAGIDGVNEWKQLYEGLAENRDKTQFQLHTIYSEDSVKSAIEQASDHSLTMELLRTEDSQSRRYDDMLINAIRSFSPHLLHFFCHGMSGARPQLELATQREKLIDAERGSVLLDEGFFSALIKTEPNIWSVMLNCCHGAAREESCSLTRRIVEIGFPAAIGMREAIAARDAEIFCGAFYRAIGKLLHDRFGGNGTGVGAGEQQEIEWVTALTEPRQRLCKERVNSIARAEEDAAWSLPVIYVRSEPFRLKRSELDEARVMSLIEEIRTLNESREQLGQSGVPQSVLTGIDDRIAELAAELTSVAV